MTRSEMSEIVYETLRQLCDTKEVEIADSCDPFDDLGLDSQDGIELACELSEKMGKLIPNDQNPFVDDKTGHARNVGTIIDFLVSIEPTLDSIAVSDGQ